MTGDQAQDGQLRTREDAAMVGTQRSTIPKAVREILDQLADGAGIIDPTGHHLYANPALLARSGHTAERLQTAAFSELLAPGDRAEARRVFRQALRGKEVILPSLRTYLGDGSLTEVELSASRFAWRGQLIGIIYVVRTLETRVSATRRLARQGRDLQLLQQVTAAVNRSLQLDRLLHTSLRSLLEATEADAGAIFRVRPRRRTLELVAHTGVPRGRLSGLQHLTIGEGYSGRAARTARPQFGSAPDRPESVPCAVFGRESSYIAVPLHCWGRVVGVMTLMSRRPDAFSSHDAELLLSIGQAIGIALHNATSYERVKEERRQLHARVAELEALQTCQIDLQSSIEPDRVLKLILRQVRRVVPCDSAYLLLRVGRQLMVKAQEGGHRSGVGWSFDFTKSVLFQRMLTRREPVILSDARNDKRFARPEEETSIRSTILLPLISRNRVLGVLMVSKEEPGFYGPSHLPVLRTFAGQAALAYDNAHLHEELTGRAQRAATILAQERERQRIALAIHDGAAQSMAQVLYRLQGCLAQPPRETSTFMHELEETAEDARNALAELRIAMRDLHPAWDPRLGVVGCVRRLAKRFDAEHGIEVTVTSRGRWRVSPATAIAGCFIVQEALTNVRKHARAQHVSIEMLEMRGGSWVEMSIRDDGVGYQPVPAEADIGEHLGLASMEERAELLGGQFGIRCRSAGGTKVWVRLPAHPFAGGSDEEANSSDGRR
jgi:PAS domain S-box-containing protein